MLLRNQRNSDEIDRCEQQMTPKEALQRAKIHRLEIDAEQRRLSQCTGVAPLASERRHNAMRSQQPLGREHRFYLLSDTIEASQGETRADADCRWLVRVAIYSTRSRSIVSFTTGALASPGFQVVLPRGTVDWSLVGRGHIALVAVMEGRGMAALYKFCCATSDAVRYLPGRHEVVERESGCGCLMPDWVLTAEGAMRQQLNSTGLGETGDESVEVALQLTHTVWVDPPIYSGLLDTSCTVRLGEPIATAEEIRQGICGARRRIRDLAEAGAREGLRYAAVPPMNLHPWRAAPYRSVSRKSRIAL